MYPLPERLASDTTFIRHVYRKAGMAEFLLVPSLIMGGIIGLIELFFVHADERGLGWLGHGLHALPVAIIFTFISMNLAFAAGLVGFDLLESFWIDLGLRVLIGIIAALKVKSAAAIVKGHNTVGEKLGHALIVGALIAASPYIWPFLAPILPAYLGGTGGASA